MKDKNEPETTTPPTDQGLAAAGCYADEIKKLRNENRDLRRLHHLEMECEKRKLLEDRMRANRDRIREIEIDSYEDKLSYGYEV